MKKTQADRLAEAIAHSVFRVGECEEADHLILYRNGQKGAGWALGPFVKEVSAVIQSWPEEGKG
jgi:hypothetical protein